ncbi:MAG TPA: GNAT family N-acetyltransferase [Candidatus Acidoferrales bacterium]|nr:GNAT family N-acetyltransferase [Candidatus Acidoferrales bacterium]
MEKIRNNGDGAEYVVRAAIHADAAVIAHHRAAMFRDMGLIPDDEVPAHETASRAYLAMALPSGEYLGWVVEVSGEVVAGGGVLVRRMLPRPGWPQGGEEAYVLNMYTEPAHRRRGLARALMETILAWCRARLITRVSLHASDDGRPLYESLGFLPTNEMRLEGVP